MPGNPYSTYESANIEGMSQRELEASVLTKAGVMFKRCQENWDAPDRDEKLAEAIKYNQMVWSFFQAELVQPDNPLPKKLREDILSLSVFIDKRLFEVLAYPNPEKLNAVININFNLASGLRINSSSTEQAKLAENF
jgi:flagellar protein FlaF